jgi:hypothetical protein
MAISLILAPRTKDRPQIRQHFAEKYASRFSPGVNPIASILLLHGQMNRAGRRNTIHARVSKSAHIKAGKEIFTRAKKDRRNGKMHVVDQAAP